MTNQKESVEMLLVLLLLYGIAAFVIYIAAPLIIRWRAKRKMSRQTDNQNRLDYIQGRIVEIEYAIAHISADIKWFDECTDDDNEGRYTSKETQLSALKWDRSMLEGLRAMETELKRELGIV